MRLRDSLESVISYQLSDVSFQFTDYCLLFTENTPHTPLAPPDECPDRLESKYGKKIIYFREPLLNSPVLKL